MFPFRKKKKANVSTQPLVPESPFTRDIERGDAESSRTRSVALPPSRKDYWDFPPQWHERRGILVAWSYLSMATVLFICCPGAICGVVGGSIYTCRCCAPKKNAKGMKMAFCINIFSFIALFVDILSVVVCIAIGTFYIIADCAYAESLCDFRSIIGLVIYGGSGLAIVRIIVTFNVFLSMRDYRREILREELLEKRIQDELDNRFREYQKRTSEKKKSKKSRGTSSTVS